MTFYVVYDMENRVPLATLLQERLHELDIAGRWGIATVPNCHVSDLTQFAETGTVFGSFASAEEERFNLLTHEMEATVSDRT
jgi:hypothetical protein